MKDGIKARIDAAGERLNRPGKGDGAVLSEKALAKAVLRCAARNHSFTADGLIAEIEEWALDKPELLKEASAEAIAQLREALAIGPE
jgi:hypothetical protein